MTEPILLRHTRNSTLAGKEQRFDRDSIVLGRSGTCDVSFDPQVDLAVSGRHCEIYREGDLWFVKDLDSRNGTWVNGERIEVPTPVRPQDSVCLGQEGPEIRINPEIGVRAMPTMTMPRKKEGIGQETLQRVVRKSVSDERARMNRRFAISGVLAAILIAGGIYLYMQNQGEIRKTQKDTESVLSKIDELETSMQARMGKVLSAHQRELEGLKGKIDDKEREVARLMVELQLLDKNQTRITKDEALSKENREALLKKIEDRILALNARFEKAQLEARAKTPGIDWADLVARYEQGIFLIVASKSLGKGRSQTGQGTAFCVREDGLLATNAHVAQMLDWAEQAIAIQNRTGRVFTIEKHLANSEFSGAASPDVGLIQLAAKGNPIPTLPLASREDLDQLRIGTHLGTLGFPGELQEKYLSIIDRKKKTIPSVLATFKDGWIGRMTDYKSSTARFEDARYIQHSASLTGGTSGSPMFTKDGKVVAMNNATQEVILQSSTASGHVEKARFASAAQIAFAIRIDELTRFMTKANF